MATKTPKLVKATLDFSATFRVPLQATESKWKQLTKESRDPDETWEEQAEWLIQFLCEEIAEETLTDLFAKRISADPVWDAIQIKGLHEADVIEVTCCDLDGLELEEVE